MATTRSLATASHCTISPWDSHEFHEIRFALAYLYNPSRKLIPCSSQTLSASSIPVQVIEVVPDQRIVLQWDAAEGEPPNVEDANRPEMATAGYKTTVTMNFKALEDGRTLVEIAEEGWRENQGALDASYGNCQGWTGMLLALKVWLEHGINLREGLYK